MNREKARTYIAEFKAPTVKLANESSKPIVQTARDLSVNENTLHTWINKYSRPLDQDKAVRTDDHLCEELRRRCSLDRGAGFIKKGTVDSMGESNI